MGLGLVMQVLVLAVKNAVNYRDLGTATSVATFFRSIGGSFGGAILRTIFRNTLKHNLTSAIPSGAGAAIASMARDREAGIMQESATMAPDLELPDARGNPVRLSGYRGEQQIVVFFTRSFL